MKQNISKVNRTHVYRHAAQVRRSIRRMGAVWGGESSKFRGFDKKAGK